MEGSIIFLTRRTVKSWLDYRGFVSYMIAKLTRDKGQSIEEVKVHAAIIYRDVETLMVREMDTDGDVHFTFKVYKELNGDKMEIVTMNSNEDESTIKLFNYACKNTKSKYDYKNTFISQVIKSVTHKFIGRESKFRRMCAEDVQRMYNIINPVFNTPEEINPNELYNLITTK